VKSISAKKTREAGDPWGRFETGRKPKTRVRARVVKGNAFSNAFTPTAPLTWPRAASCGLSVALNGAAASEPRVKVNASNVDGGSSPGTS